MKIFTDEFIDKLIERGEDYYKSFKEYNSELKNKSFFDEYDTDGFKIDEIKFSNYGDFTSLTYFQKEINKITIYYSYKEYYCSREGEYTSEKITLPGWILMDEEDYKRKKSFKLDSAKKYKLEQESLLRERNLRQLKEWAKDLGYRIEKEEK